MIYKNPYYVNKDPLKTILFDGNNGSGKPMIYRNPCVPGAEYGHDVTTYEKWQNKGFIQTNVIMVKHFWVEKSFPKVFFAIT